MSLQYLADELSTHVVGSSARHSPPFWQSQSVAAFSWHLSPLKPSKQSQVPLLMHVPLFLQSQSRVSHFSPVQPSVQLHDPCSTVQNPHVFAHWAERNILQWKIFSDYWLPVITGYRFFMGYPYLKNSTSQRVLLGTNSSQTSTSPRDLDIFCRQKFRLARIGQPENLKSMLETPYWVINDHRWPLNSE